MAEKMVLLYGEGEKNIKDVNKVLMQVKGRTLDLIGPLSEMEGLKLIIGFQEIDNLEEILSFLKEDENINEKKNIVKLK